MSLQFLPCKISSPDILVFFVNSYFFLLLVFQFIWRVGIMSMWAFTKRIPIISVRFKLKICSFTAMIYQEDLASTLVSSYHFLFPSNPSDFTWSTVEQHLKIKGKKTEFALVNVKSFIFCYFRGSCQQFLPLELHKPEVLDSSWEINGWTAPHLTPHRSSSLWVWDLPYGPSCFKTSDDDRLGRTLSEVCPPILYILLHARDLILLTPGLLYALWHSFFFFFLKQYYYTTCKRFEWW